MVRGALPLFINLRWACKAFAVNLRDTSPVHLNAFCQDTQFFSVDAETVTILQCLWPLRPETQALTEPEQNASENT